MRIGDQELPDGTYFYVVDLVDGSEARSGYIILKDEKNCDEILLTTVLSLILVFTYRHSKMRCSPNICQWSCFDPAYAGTHESLEFSAIVRDQWTGLPGAPSTQTLSLHTPLHNRNIGLGFMLINDKIGITRQTGAYGAYAYKVRLNDRGVLSMGLQAGFTSTMKIFRKLYQP